MYYAQEIAAALTKVIQVLGISLREAARRTGVDRSTITRTLEGDTVADLVTLAMLEQGLHVSLWPPFHHVRRYRSSQLLDNQTVPRGVSYGS
ncbi:MAG: helix-turn-helix transcriptional regulator [Candidatus Nanopelagicales bacterium]|nr:helix-turn-helix transcriptional regulator [Candidatus Nanopelagicales bacterium]